MALLAEMYQELTVSNALFPKRKEKIRLAEIITELIGKKNALVFFLRFGGQEFYFAQRQMNRELLSLMGDEVCDKLYTRFRGLTIAIPFAKALCARWLAQEGLTQSAIARKLRVSRTSVRRWQLHANEHD